MCATPAKVGHRMCRGRVDGGGADAMSAAAWPVWWGTGGCRKTKTGCGRAGHPEMRVGGGRSRSALAQAPALK